MKTKTKMKTKIVKKILGIIGFRYLEVPLGNQRKIHQMRTTLQEQASTVY